MAKKALMSYCWAGDSHNQWVEALASRLRQDGVETTLDQWSLGLGDSLTQFMETAVRENDFVLIVCTPEYKKKADERLGGVGYESDLMTAEKFVDGKRGKFIPILRAGTWSSAAPSWIKGVVGANLSSEPFSESEYQKLSDHLNGRRRSPPPVNQSNALGDVPSNESNENAPFDALSAASTAHSTRKQIIHNHGAIANQTNIQAGVVNMNSHGKDKE